MLKAIIYFLLVFVCSDVLAQKDTVTCKPKEIVTINNAGKQIAKANYEYNDRGQVISEKMIVDYGGTPSETHIENTYDQLNKLIKKDIYVNKKLTNSLSFTFDLNGNKITEINNLTNSISNINILNSNILEVINLYPDGSTKSIIRTEKSDKRTSVTHLNGARDIISEETTLFNANGKISLNEIREILTGTSRKIEYEYDKTGNIVTEKHSYNSNLIRIISYEYEGNLKKLQRGVLKNGKEDFRVEYNFSNGKEIEIKNYNNEVFDSKIEKKYDASGNLSEEFTSNKQGQIIKRTNYIYECE